MTLKSHLLAAVGGVAILASAASASFADIDWTVSGKFSDNNTFTGSFVIDVYNQLSIVLITDSGASYTYNSLLAIAPILTTNLTGDHLTVFQNNKYNGPTLILDFSGSLLKAGSLTLTGGYECTNTYSCGSLSATRLVSSGSAIGVPGPEAGSGLLSLAATVMVFGWRRRRPGVAQACGKVWADD